MSDFVRDAVLVESRVNQTSVLSRWRVRVWLVDVFNNGRQVKVFDSKYGDYDHANEMRKRVCDTWEKAPDAAVRQALGESK